MELNGDYILMCTLMFIRLHVVSSQTYDEAVTLLRNKTYFYERSIRPVKNQSSTLDVHINFELVSVQDFDKIQDSLTVIGGLTLTWTDNFINWTPADYGGIKDIVSESGKFWTPYLILINNANKFDKVGETWQRIRFTHEGVATVIQADTFSTLCKADVKYYPWDDHWCGFEFSSVAYRPGEMSLLPVMDEVDIFHYVESGIWELLGSTIQVRNQNTTIMFHIHLARKPLFVVVNVILPIVAMTFLNAIVFLIPAESGERISYSITVLLAIAVFETLVGENLPRKSNPMPAFCFYLLTILMISVAIAFANIFSLQLYHLDNTDPANGVFATLTKWVLHRIKNEKKVITIESTNTSMEETETGNTESVNTLRESVDYPIKAFSIDSNMKTDVTWREVSAMFDKMCFIVVNTLLALTVFVFFMVLYMKERNP